MTGSCLDFKADRYISQNWGIDMKDDELLRYYQLLEELTEAMNDDDGFELESIEKALAGLCELFGICRGVTEYYKNTIYEHAGKGERFVCYDNGEPGEVIMERRVITKNLAVAKCKVYQAEGAVPLTDDDRKRVDLIMRAVLRFITHNRLLVFVEQMTFYDESGYPNLRSFTRYLEGCAEKGGLYGQTAVHFNLRHFTLINQEIGRTGGDIVMRNYFRLIQDVIGDDGIVCRVGGDNFVCIFSSDKTEQVLEIMKGAPAVYDVEGEKRVMVSSSAGVFVVPDDFVYRNLGDVMDKVLACSRAARDGGQESIVYFDSRMAEGKEKVMRVQQLFPQALENGEFKVFYQPKIDVETGELAGAEALCRWIRNGRIVPPMEFIPILEQNTDICKLDFHMLDMVCKDIKRWLAEGRQVVRVSVNLSRKHMMDVDLLEHILKIIDENEVPHKYIEIELTETTTDVEFKDLKRVVNGLQMAGIYTSVDDFGMGYSSLKLIREIPWNVLKVDKSFLPVDEDSDESTRTIMFKYVVAMAKALGLETIAEGVETEHQVDVLRINRCSLAQGFLFDKPLPLNEFEDRLTKHRYDMNK